MSGQTKSSSLVRKTAHELRVLVAKCEPEGLLGFEDELLERLGVSRPTLRQAAALVAQEQLLTVKRGGGGGYFARIPSASAVAHMAAIYLQAHKAGLREIVQSIEPNTVEITRLAARNRDVESVRALEDFVDRERKLDEKTMTRADFIRGFREYNRIIGAMSRNRVLTLILEILDDALNLRGSELEAWVGELELVSRYRTARLQVCQAVVDGDEEVAALMAKRCVREFTVWMLKRLDDLGQ
jgi:DNA-binding FadR family transcriptional regulator